MTRFREEAEKVTNKFWKQIFPNGHFQLNAIKDTSIPFIAQAIQAEHERTKKMCLEAAKEAVQRECKHLGIKFEDTKVFHAVNSI